MRKFHGILLNHQTINIINIKFKEFINIRSNTSFRLLQRCVITKCQMFTYICSKDHIIALKFRC